MALASPREHVPELDGVRGIACLLVITLHCFVGQLTSEFYFGPPHFLSGVFVVLAGGVDFFFVLSGFLIGGILLDSRSASNFFRVFWARRAARILPVYVLLLGSYVAALSFSPLFNAPWVGAWLLHEPLMPLWSYATFTQNYLMAAAGDTGAFWIAITWSLAVEEQFYLVFPVLIYLVPKRGLVVLALASLVFAALLRTYLWSRSGTFYAGYFPTPARVDTLMFGFLSACIVRNPTAVSYLASCRTILDIAAAGALGLIFEGSQLEALPSLRFSLLAAVFAYAIVRIFVVSGGWYRAALRNPLLVQAGLVSYAWYMYHQAINGMVHGLLFQQAPRISNAKELAAACMVLLLSGGLAALSTRYYERPFRAWGRRMRYRFDGRASTSTSVARSLTSGA
jgi:peptidoglycan/LPS O-acetylase OafA/YrhL